MTRTIVLDIESRPECIELLSGALCGVCHLVLPAVDIAPVNLAMVEAVNNVVEHAYHGESGHSVRVEFELAPNRLHLRVRDRGEPMAPGRLEAVAALVAPDPEDPDSLRTRGRGLAIIKSCMDTVNYEARDGVNTLSMSRALATGEAI
ncbi:MAG: ATP-binding protein [Candidatus Competibacter sp.]|nr:ATP-binding protein [Candidatus Competibacter sp.]MDS4069354.1 ATP-binding protein [Candidatus Competibacter sp.]